MSDVLKWKGRRAEAEQQVYELRIRIRGYVDALRDALDPMEKAEQIDHEVIAEQALALSNMVVSLRQALAEIAEINRLLGR
jgi:hypothetical protein